MSLKLEDEIIYLEGFCHVEDAEELLALVQTNASHPVDLTHCSHLHAALVQILLTFRPTIIGICGDPFIRDWLLPSFSVEQTSQKSKTSQGRQKR
jgi:hypothetical protein